MKGFYQKHLPYSAVLLSLLCPLSWAAQGTLEGIQYDATQRSFLLKSSGTVQAALNTVEFQGKKRILLDMDQAEIGAYIPRDAALLQQLKSQWPEVDTVSVTQFGDKAHPLVRVLIDLKGTAHTVSLIREKGPVVTVQAYANQANKIEQKGFSTATSEPAISETALKRSLASLSQQYEALTQENQALKKQLEQAATNRSESIQPLKEELTRLKNQYTALEKKALESKNLLEENTALKTELEQLKKLTTQVSTEKETYDISLQEQLKKAKQDLLESVQLINQQSKEMANLKQKMVQVEAQTTQAAKQQIEILNTKLEEKEAELKRLQQQVEGQRRLESSQLNTQQLKKTLVVLNHKYDLLLTENQALQKQLEGLVAEKKTLQEYKAGVESQQSKATAQRQALEQQLNGLQEKVKLLQQQPIAPANISQHKDYLALQQEKENLQHREVELKQSLVKIENAYAKLDLEMKESKQEKEKLSSQLSKLQGEQASLQPQRTLQQKKIISLQEVERQLETQLQENTKRYEHLAAEKELLSKRVAELEKLNQSLLGNQANEKATLSKRVAELEQLNRSLQNTQALEKETSNKRIAELEKINQSLQVQVTSPAEKAKLSQELAMAQRKAIQLQEQIDQTNLEKLHMAEQKVISEDLGKQLTGLRAQLETTSTELAQTQQKNQNLQTELEQYKKTTLANKAKPAIAPSNLEEAEKQFSTASQFEKIEHYDLALAAYDKALQLSPSQVKYSIGKASTLIGKGNHPEAIALLKRVLEKDPYNWEAYNYLGKAYLFQGDAENAKEAFAKAINNNALNNYASTLKKLGKLEEAEKVLKLAQQLNPTDSDLFFNLGNVYNAMNNMNAAKQAYGQAILLKDTFPEAHYNLGILHSMSGDKRNAVLHFEKFLEQSPEASNRDQVKDFVKKLKS